MIHKATKDEKLLFRSMGKSFAITAIATTDEEANEHMRKHDDDAVIASFGPFVLMANKHDAGKA
jgi:hypothetical protein